MSGLITRCIEIGTATQLNEGIADAAQSLDVGQKQLFNEYLGMGKSPDALFLRECSAIAFTRFLEQHDMLEDHIHLTPYGLHQTDTGSGRQLTAKRRVWQEWKGDWGDYTEMDSLNADNQRFIQQASASTRAELIQVLLGYNLEFLSIWDEIRHQSKTRRDQLRATISPTPAQVQAQGEARERINGTVDITPMPKVIAQVLVEDGFRIKDHAQVTASEVLEKGLKIEAINDSTGETREVIIGPEGTITTHVDVPGAPHQICMKAAEVFSERVGDAIKHLITGFGLKATLITKVKKADVQAGSKAATIGTQPSGSRLAPLTPLVLKK